MTHACAMLMELSTGRTRPMRASAPVHSSAEKRWDGFLVEQYGPAQWESRNVSLLQSAIYLTLDGGADLEWRSSNRTISRRLVSGQVSILPAHHPYSVKLRAGGGSIIVSFEQKLLACAAAEQGFFGEVEPTWAHGVNDSLIRELVLALLNETRASTAEKSNYPLSLASMLAAHIVRRYSTDALQRGHSASGLSLRSLRAAIHFIHDNLAGNIAVSHLAALAQLSQAHFARMFKLTTGLAPHQYILHCRLSRARTLLLNPSLTLADVASQSGFCDQAHMTRVFGKVLGTTPSYYARRLAG